MRVPLGFGDITDEQKRLVNVSMDSNQTSRSEFTAWLEQLIAEECGTRMAVFMASGTCALHLALEAMKTMHEVEDGVVIVPATTFIASWSAVIHAGLTPVLCDVRLDYFNMEMGLAQDAAKEHGALAIMPVHLLGRACDMDAAVDMADVGGFHLIEDCCEALGVTYKGDPVGSFGLAGAISTYVSHHLSTGTGGAVVTNDEFIYHDVLSRMQHGKTKRSHVFDKIGYSYRSTELEAALGVGVLSDRSVWEARQESRVIIARELNKVMDPYCERIVPQVWPEGSVPMFFPIVCRTWEDRIGLNDAFQDAEIETRPVPTLMTQEPVLKLLREQGKTPDDYPNAKSLAERSLMIGCHPGLGKEHIDWVSEVTNRYFSQRK